MRGWAILLVIAFHVLGSIYGGAPRRSLPVGLGLLFGGDTGVTLFFVLSGFLLSLPPIQGRPFRASVFYRNRALRILPLYYFVVLVAALWTAKWWNALQALAFTNIELRTLMPFGSVWWSLAVEVQFYLLLPLLVWLWRDEARRPALWMVLLLAAVMYWQVSRSYDMTSSLALLRNSIFARWPAFVLGMFLAFTTVRWGTWLKSWAERSRQAGWLSLALFVAALFILSLLTHRRVATFDRLYAHVVWFDHNSFEALAWTVVLGVLLFLRLPGRRLVINPVMDRIGIWSYSIYLIHLPVIKLLFEENVKRHPGIFARPLPWTALLAASLALTLLLSVSTYYAIERPFLRLKSRPPRVRRPVYDAA